MRKRRSIKLNGFIAILAAGFVVWNRIDKEIGHEYWFSCLLDCLGFAALISGIVVRISARGYKTQWLKSHNTLVKSGPYALVRNPMYLGSFLIGLGLVTALTTIWMVPIYIIFYVLWYWPQIHLERNHLIIKFSQEYLDYENSIPCFFPRLSDVVRCQPELALPLRLLWLRKELPLIFTMFIVLLLSEGFEDISNFGWPFYIVDLLIMSIEITIVIIVLWVICYKAPSVKQCRYNQPCDETLIIASERP
ncbi:MAG: isoprenylcysteine carboxylmethyltransferase family protein [Phycisphaerae bacterium]|nr:isoprenylcysteine carboxylmethyltransferase family protein [Phycisphaerae bacterium]